MLDRKYHSDRRQEITAALDSQRGLIADLELKRLNTPPGQSHEKAVLFRAISSETNILRWMQGRYDEANEALRAIDRLEAKTG